MKFRGQPRNWYNIFLESFNDKGPYTLSNNFFYLGEEEIGIGHFQCLKWTDSEHFIKIINLKVDKDKRLKAHARKIVDQLCQLADEKNATILLHPQANFGSNGNLIDFFQAWGFRENRGGDRNFNFTEKIYRKPNKKS